MDSKDTSECEITPWIKETVEEQLRALTTTKPISPEHRRISSQENGDGPFVIHLSENRKIQLLDVRLPANEICLSVCHRLTSYSSVPQREGHDTIFLYQTRYPAYVPRYQKMHQKLSEINMDDQL
jgi:hypothetical protein